MSDLSIVHDEITIKLESISKTANTRTKTSLNTALKANRTSIVSFLDSVITTSKYPDQVKDIKGRVLELLDGKTEFPNPTETPQDRVLTIMGDLNSALGWAEPHPVDDLVIAEVVARDRAEAKKLKHPVGKIKKVV